MLYTMGTCSGSFASRVQGDGFYFGGEIEMARKCLLVIGLWLSVLAVGQNRPHQTDEQLEAKRQNFSTGRQLLLNKGIPFDPDELLRDGWRKNLKSTLDAIPEMHQTRYEIAPLKDVYLADTLYLPETVQLSGHTLILANYVVFEGKNPVIKGNFDIHFFPTKPVVVLGTTLSELLHKNTRLLDVSSHGRPPLPQFLQIKDLVPGGKHNITIDVSGTPFPAAPPRLPPQRPAPKLRTTSWKGINELPLILPQINCSTSCDNSGQPQNPAQEGSSPGKEALGNPNFPNGLPAASTGSCNSGSNIEGANGTNGGDGVGGDTAGDGAQGLPGNNAGNINVSITNGDTNQYTFTANGGPGQNGGPGGTGGTGGDGGQGQAGGTGASNCSNCTAGDGGEGGRGGASGIGGMGGTGGQGGVGGNGGNINGTYSYDGPVPNASVAGGAPGAGGAFGSGGVSGNPGAGGPGGQAGSACGVSARTGGSQGGGPATGSKGPGKPGPNGTSSGTAGSVNLTQDQPPGGGGGDGGGCGNVGGDGYNPDDGGAGNDGCSPILIDTAREGFHLTSALNGVVFDISGTGKPIQIAWTDSHFQNAFLALPGPDGLVHSGKELFGNFTSQPQSASPNGFIALAQFDKPENGGNGDGIIDEKDDVYSKLRLWIDENHDGICQPEELHRLPELGVYSLALSYVESRRTDQFGNQFRYKGLVNPGERKDPRDQTDSGIPGRWMYDVFFVAK